MESVLELGDVWNHEFAFTQEQVQAFAEVTGDNNPLHLDAEYAAGTAFKSPVIHGMLGACVFSRVLGTIKPGPKSIYLGQQLEFKKPLYPGRKYLAVFEAVARENKRFRIRTTIQDLDTGEVLTEGEAQIRVR